MVVRSPQRLPSLPLQQVSCSAPGPPPGGIPSFPSLFSVTLSLSLSSEVLYLWPAASQPTPGALQDEMTLNCSEASSEEALLPSIPRTGEPHPQGGETALPTPQAQGPCTVLGSFQFAVIHLHLLCCEGEALVQPPEADL